MRACGDPGISYTYSFSMSLIPERNHNESHMDHEDNNSFGDSSFYLRGQRLKLTTVRDKTKMSWVDLFGTIGGNLGLFVGVSLTTILEFAEFGFLAIWKWYYGKKIDCS